MMIPNEMIFHTGLAMVCFAVLGTAVAIPVFLLIEKQLQKQLETTYGKQSDSEKQ